ncbi:MAG: hypothetical protein FWE36_03465 [Erysipelotrichales bacterium]|nr:hypothetical protein [Erysipelotrichales bacterium]
MKNEYLSKRNNRLFQTKTGSLLIQILDSLNIMAKSKPKDDEVIQNLRNSGLTTPIRLQVTL